MSDSNRSLVFSFAFYHHVKYLGDCSPIKHPNMYGENDAVPLDLSLVGSITFSAVGFILNFLALMIFCASENGCFLNLRNIVSQTTVSDSTGKKESSQPSSQTILSSRGSGAPKNSVTLSLLLLSLCECVFTLSKLVFDLLTILGNRTITNTSTKLTIQTVSVLQNLIFFLADVGILCRNWCVLLITIARAEVVLWPLGAKGRQRVLRSRLQGIIVWILIFIFTIIIVCRLKPWRREIEHLFDESISRDGATSVQSVQMDAMKRRQKSQIRATRVVVTIVLVFLLLELFNCITTILEVAEVIIRDSQEGININQAGNTLVAIDSVCNFFIFILTLKQFRIACKQLFCKSCTKRQSERTVVTKATSDTSAHAVNSNSPPASEAVSIKLDLE
ncbi:hypothetical protein CRM22_003385 [Opisthorchis felineus]|uniref:G-protein coupled receptors family 1 profile domain-containing protein n=1 Tax=Opisthorchis felineus TaxID=147828 RepID=A0A4S2M1F0_OPIFE|nr:hypothetical protein CRM22_003385 [Opisthorchis felineus]